MRQLQDNFLVRIILTWRLFRAYRKLDKLEDEYCQLLHEYNRLQALNNTESK